MLVRLGFSIIAAALIAYAPAFADGLSSEDSGGAGASSGQSTGAGQSADQPAAAPDSQSGSQYGQSAAVPQADAETTKILADLHRTNIAEINMGKLGQERAQSESVKQYAEMIVKDHEAAQDKVEKLADQLQVKLPDADQTTAAKEQAAMDHLKSLQGAAFDKAFSKHMAEEHGKAITTVKASQKKLSGAAAQLVQEILPVLQQHQKTGKQLARNPAAPISAGGAGATSGEASSSEGSAQ